MRRFEKTVYCNSMRRCLHRTSRDQSRKVYCNFILVVKVMGMDVFITLADRGVIVCQPCGVAMIILFHVETASGLLQMPVKAVGLQSCCHPDPRWQAIAATRSPVGPNLTHLPQSNLSERPRQYPTRFTHRHFLQQSHQFSWSH